MALGLQPLDDIHPLRHVLGSARIMFGRLDAQGFQVFKESLRIPISEFAQRCSFFVGPLDGAVIHIGQVLNLGYLETEYLQGSAENVLKEKGAVIPDVRIVVDRGAAGIEPSLTFVDRFELLELPVQRVE